MLLSGMFKTGGQWFVVVEKESVKKKRIEDRTTRKEKMQAKMKIQKKRGKERGEKERNRAGEDKDEWG